MKQYENDPNGDTYQHHLKQANQAYEAKENIRKKWNETHQRKATPDD